MYMPEDLCEYSDFRGLIHADHPEAIEEIESYNHSIAKTEYSSMNESSKMRRRKEFPVPLYMQDKNYEEGSKTLLCTINTSC